MILIDPYGRVRGDGIYGAYKHGRNLDARPDWDSKILNVSVYYQTEHWPRGAGLDWAHAHNCIIHNTSHSKIVDHPRVREAIIKWVG